MQLILHKKTKSFLMVVRPDASWEWRAIALGTPSGQGRKCREIGLSPRPEDLAGRMAKGERKS